MSYQFDPSRHEAHLSRSLQDTLLSFQDSSCGDPRAQQSLHMGSNSPYLGSFPPSGNNPSNDPSIRQVSFSPTPLILSHNVSSPRIMYPSSLYTYGNPVYYYDPLHHPVSMCTQTESLYVPGSAVQPTMYHHTTRSNQPPTLPSTPGIVNNFGHLDPAYRVVSPVACHPNHNYYSSHQAPSSLGGDQHLFIPYGTACEEVPPILPVFDVESMPDMMNHSLSLDPHPISVPGPQVGCQVSPMIQPVLLKDPNKLSIPFYDPRKLPWHTFSMKLHATLIDCNMDYLLSEQSTTVHNGKHSKELMVELYKKLHGSALALFSSLHAQQFCLGGGRGVEMFKL